MAKANDKGGNGAPVVTGKTKRAVVPHRVILIGELVRPGYGGRGLKMVVLTQY